MLPVVAAGGHPDGVVQHRHPPFDLGVAAGRDDNRHLVQCRIADRERVAGSRIVHDLNRDDVGAVADRLIDQRSRRVDEARLAGLGDVVAQRKHIVEVLCLRCPAEVGARQDGRHPGRMRGLGRGGRRPAGIVDRDIGAHELRHAGIDRSIDDRDRYPCAIQAAGLQLIQARRSGIPLSADGVVSICRRNRQTTDRQDDHRERGHQTPHQRSPSSIASGVSCPAEPAPAAQ